MKFSGNYIQGYAHLFFGEDFNPMRYTGIYYKTPCGRPIYSELAHFLELKS